MTRNKNALRGGMGAWIIIVMLIFVATGYSYAKFGPVYREKWRLEDEMRVILERYSMYLKQNEWDADFDMKNDLREYTQKVNHPLDPTKEEACAVMAEIGQAGTFSCNYVVDVKFPGYTYKMNVTASVTIKKIQASTF